MKLDSNQIREILFAKNNCTALEFHGYLKLVAEHFGYDVLNYDEMVDILKQIASEDPSSTKLVIAAPVTHVQPELCIIKTTPYSYPF